MQPLSVSILNDQIKSYLETTFSSVYVEGEISNLTYHNSGHIYFSLKDEKSTVSCVMFRGNAASLKFRLEAGLKVLVNANLTVYAPRGSYQLICSKVSPSGTGELAMAYEQLKAKLQIKGYFNKEIKKPLPKFPNTIYIVTSNTGAAIEDMKKIAQARYPLIKIVLLPTLVQGSDAKLNIAQNIQIADSLALKNGDNNIIIVGRGGGSIEDLWAFNEEIVADAIFQAKTPIISAVGHESDVVISDFVADVRASTPSNAIELATPHINDLRIYIDTLLDQAQSIFLSQLEKRLQQIKQIQQLFSHHSFDKKHTFMEQSIQSIHQQLNLQMVQSFNLKQNKLKMLEQTFQAYDPSKKDKFGFVQLVHKGKIGSLNDLEKGDTIQLQNSHYAVDCQVLMKKSF